MPPAGGGPVVYFWAGGLVVRPDFFEGEAAASRLPTDAYPNGRLNPLDIAPERIGVDADGFVLGVLQASGTLGALLASQWVDWAGSSEAIVPRNVGRERALRLLERGFKSSGRLVDHAAEIAKAWLSSPGRVAFTPHWLGRSTDTGLARPSTSAFVTSEDEVLYFLTDPNLSASYFDRACMVPSYVTVLTSTRVPPRPRQEFGRDDLAEWAAAAEMMFVSAYDGESFVVLRRRRRE